MIWSSVKNNIRTILRNPSTILAVLAAIIMEFMYGINHYAYMDGTPVGKELYLSDIAFERILNKVINVVSNPITNIVFVFIGVVIAIHLFVDLRTQNTDVLFSSLLSFRQYFISKIITYYLFSLMVAFGLSVVHGILYIIFYIPANPNFDAGMVWFTTLIAMLVLYTSVLLIPLSLAIFCSALSGVPAVGALVNCGYYYIPYMLGIGMDNFYSCFIHVTPWQLWLYLKYWGTYTPDERFSEITSITNAGHYVNIQNAIFSYILQIAIAAVLLTASYFLLKRRFQKS